MCTDEAFAELQRGFLAKHCHHFDDSEENKFIYTEIFKAYVSYVQRETRLSRL